MKFASFRNSLSVLLAAVFGFTSIPSQAKTHCPGNIPGVRPRFVAGALLVISVKINQAGPFDFLVDTGSQPNVIDPLLASSLDLKSQGPVGLITASTLLQGSVVALTSLEAGGYTLKNPVVVVEDLGPLQAADPRIRGVLGENFLAHFDILIDYSQQLLCLDRSNRMQGDLHGERIPLVAPKHPEDELPFLGRLVISVSLSDSGNRDILLQLDSGSTGPVLYSGNVKVKRLLRKARMQGSDVDETHRAFAVLPPQNMRIGAGVIRNVPFVTPVRPAGDVPNREEDGILATGLFQRVYVSHSDRFVIFDPK
jgi:hypothetical protein